MPLLSPFKKYEVFSAEGSVGVLPVVFSLLIAAVVRRGQKDSMVEAFLIAICLNRAPKPPPEGSTQATGQIYARDGRMHVQQFDNWRLFELIKPGRDSLVAVSLEPLHVPGIDGIRLGDTSNQVGDRNAMVAAKLFPCRCPAGMFETKLSVNAGQNAPKMIAGIEVCRVVRNTAVEPVRGVFFGPRWVEGSYDQGSWNKIDPLQEQVVVKFMMTCHGCLVNGAKMVVRSRDACFVRLGYIQESSILCTHLFPTQLGLGI